MSLTKVRKAKKLLNRYAPKGEQLAFINSKEAKLLKKLGGAGVNIKGTGIKSYFDDSGDDYGGYDSGSSSSSSNDNNSDNDSGSSYDYIPQQFTPAPTPTPTQTFADDDYTLTPEETKEQQDTISSSIDDLKNTIEDDGTSLYTTTPDYTYDEKKGIYSAPTFQGPYVDSRNDPFTTAKNTDTGFFDSGIGKFIKNIGKGALLFAAPAIGGLAFGKKGYDAVNLGLKGKRAYDLAKRIAPNTTKDIKTALTNTPKGPSVKGPTGFNDNDSNEGNALVANNVIAKNIQKYSPTQVKSLQNNINLLSSVMDKGQYQGIQLSSSQLSQVSNQRNSLIEQYKTIQESLV
jgi:hypothetical protein